jgi:hypothetical protein
LEVEVRGASGNVIELNLDAHGLTVVEDPSTMVYLGYGFESPNPGEWVVKLSTTSDTPAEGAHFALAAVFDGGAALSAQTSLLLPEVGQKVNITARLSGGMPQTQTERVQARIQPVGGRAQTLQLRAEAEGFSVEWAPEQPGLHSIDIEYLGRQPNGSPVERVAFLVIEAQPQEGGNITLVLLAAGGMLLLGLGLGIGLVRWRRRR